MFCEKWFPGRVKIPITRVLGGARFDGIFEACVGNFWKRPEIMKWIVYVLALPNNDSIMQRALFIILRSVQMIAQFRFGSIFFLLFFRWDGSLITPVFWNIGSGERRICLVPLIVFTRILWISKSVQLWFFRKVSCWASSRTLTESYQSWKTIYIGTGEKRWTRFTVVAESSNACVVWSWL